MSKETICDDPGAVYEHVFFAKAMAQGLVPFVPLMHKRPQDCIIMNGAGTMYKVQVKGTATASKETDRTPRYKIQPVTGRATKRPIDCTKVDVVVGYVEPYDAIYIIPCLEIERSKSIWLYPHNENSRAKYEVYRDRWDIFKS